MSKSWNCSRTEVREKDHLKLEAASSMNMDWYNAQGMVFAVAVSLGMMKWLASGS